MTISSSDSKRKSTSAIHPTGERMLYDDFGSIRIVDPASFDSSQKLREDSQLFSTKLGSFRTISTDLLALFEAKGRQVETQKLLTVGLRNRVYNEVELRKAMISNMLSSIAEKQERMKRLNARQQSLERVLQEQTALIEALSSK